MDAVIYEIHCKSTTPPSIKEQSFTPRTGIWGPILKVYVPKGCKDIYEDKWGIGTHCFKEFIEE